MPDRAPGARSGEGAGWGPQARLPAPGQLCYESLQIARYQAGQHFRPHEVRAWAARRFRGGCRLFHICDGYLDLCGMALRKELAGIVPIT